MKIGDSVVVCPSMEGRWHRIGLVLGFRACWVLVFWGEDFPCEEEYPDQLMTV